MTDHDDNDFSDDDDDGPIETSNNVNLNFCC